jgi:hypothetical protein
MESNILIFSGAMKEQKIPIINRIYSMLGIHKLYLFNIFYYLKLGG